MVRKFCSIGVAVLFIFSLVSIADGSLARPLDLITTDEAALPDSQEEHFEAAMEEEGPVVEVVTPKNGNTYSPPLSIMVKFAPRDGREINLSTLKVEYLKLFPINITDRIMPYVNREGIKAENVNIPVGIHKIRLSVADLNGAKTTVLMIVSVQW